MRYTRIRDYLGRIVRPFGVGLFGGGSGPPLRLTWEDEGQAVFTIVANKPGEWIAAEYFNTESNEYNPGTFDDFMGSAVLTPTTATVTTEVVGNYRVVFQAVSGETATVYFNYDPSPAGLGAYSYIGRLDHPRLYVGAGVVDPGSGNSDATISIPFEGPNCCYVEHRYSVELGDDTYVDTSPMTGESPFVRGGIGGPASYQFSIYFLVGEEKSPPGQRGEAIEIPGPA